MMIIIYSYDDHHMLGAQTLVFKSIYILRFSATPKKSKYVPHQQQMEYGAFFQVEVIKTSFEAFNRRRLIIVISIINR